MQRLEVSCAVRLIYIYTSLGAKGLTEFAGEYNHNLSRLRNMPEREGSESSYRLTVSRSRWTQGALPAGND